MADTMKFDLVSPERSLASVAATEVRLPGTEGDMTVMAGHSPVITTLRPGIVRVLGDGTDLEFTVTGGFAEITGDSCTVLAERSLPVQDMTQEHFDEMVAELRARHDAAANQDLPGPAPELVKLLSDMVAMGTHIGLDPTQASL